MSTANPSIPQSYHLHVKLLIIKIITLSCQVIFMSSCSSSRSSHFHVKSSSYTAAFVQTPVSLVILLLLCHVKSWLKICLSSKSPTRSSPGLPCLFRHKILSLAHNIVQVNQSLLLLSCTNQVKSSRRLPKHPWHQKFNQSVIILPLNVPDYSVQICPVA